MGTRQGHSFRRDWHSLTHPENRLQSRRLTDLPQVLLSGSPRKTFHQYHLYTAVTSQCQLLSPPCDRTPQSLRHSEFQGLAIFPIASNPKREAPPHPTLLQAFLSLKGALCRRQGRGGRGQLCKAAWVDPGTSVLLLGSSEQRETASPAHLYCCGGWGVESCSTSGNLL